MAADSIQIISKSRVVVFSGNLMKAPPLDRRGRKKWHERYFILRANKTLECYKSRKAAEATKKSPRRVIDLRECINLEIGLEYKNLQHILSLGTFKRTFFFGAPSDALMLQWANVLEKVKNAQEGESIELLDIGLRRSKDHKAVHRVKPSTSLHQFNIKTNKTLYSTGGSKSTVTLAHFTRDRADTINLRDSQTSDVDLAPIPPKRTSSLGSRSSTASKEEESRLRVQNEELPSPHVAKPRAVAVTMRSDVRPPSDSSVREYTLRESSASISSQQSTASFRMVYIPSRVPPPMLPARKFGPHAAKTPEQGRPQDQVDFGSAAPPKRKPKEHTKEFVPKEGALRRGRAVRGASPQLKKKGSDDLRGKVLQSGRAKLEKEGSSPSLGAGSSTILHSNMKRSFRYRKITLRPEKPIFGNTQDGDNSSDEETDTETSSGIFISDEHVKKPGPNFGMNPSPPLVRKFEPDSSRPARLCVRPNSYSRVTVGSVKEREPLSDFCSRNGSVNGLRHNKILARSVGESSSDSTSESRGDLSEVTTDSRLTPDIFDLPTLQSDSFLYRSTNSLNSLDNILVEPPSMFGEERQEVEGEDEGPDSTSRNQNGNETELRGPPAGSNLESDPLTSATLLADRNSTESNDTGYTSGASPSYQEQQKLGMEFEETCARNGDNSEGEDQSSTPPQANSMYQSQTSVASSDSVRSYVPLVFHSPGVQGDRSVFAIQVCLVENSDELIKDLIALKSLEGYGLVECEEEEEEGSNVAAVGDDFTVETALEDLEFGFSIISSTQKDLFMRKVRQFQFEIKDLFGCSKKPFSCDVEIRHADQLTLLPIEVQRV